MASKRWAPAEEQQLLEELSAGKTVTEIVTIHKRTKNAIKSRINQLVVSLHASGKSPQDISQMLKLPLNMVIHAIGVNRAMTETGPASGAEKTGTRWSASDEASLIEMMKSGSTVEAAAISLQRTPASIHMHLQSIIRLHRAHPFNKSDEEIAAMLGSTVGFVQRIEPDYMITSDQ